MNKSKSLGKMYTVVSDLSDVSACSEHKLLYKAGTVWCDVFP